MSSTKFTPNWLSPPGDTMLDLIRAMKMTLDEFSTASGISLTELERLLDGRQRITDDIAVRLGEATGTPSHFWVARDEQYRESALRLGKNWADEIKIGEILKRGWVEPFQDLADGIIGALSFFETRDVGSWERRYRTVLDTAAFRTSPAYESSLGPTAAWLRRGEIEGSALSCLSWNKQKFSDAIPEIRKLTRLKDPKNFVPKIQAICGRCGVAFVILRPTSGCKASGATWMIKEDRALILMSGRYRADDHFWFTFFHEAGHVILHGDRLTVDGEEMSSNLDIENEANQFAQDVLIPKSFREEFINLPMIPDNVIRFSVKVGLAAGIVAGQLQRLRSNYCYLNGLKRRYDYVDEFPFINLQNA